MTKTRITKRIEALDRETSLEMLARAKALEASGREVIHLEIGEPDFETPDYIVKAGVEAIHGGWTHYGPSAGLPEARSAVARFVAEDRGVDVSPDQVIVSPGGKSIIFFTMLALIEAGDEVIYPNPGFPNYEMTIEFVGGRPVPVPLKEEEGFSIDLGQFESAITEKTRLAIVNTPHNPTGGVLSREVLQRVFDLADKHGFYVLSDEIYSQIVYDGSFESYYSIPGAAERTVLLDGHSKAYAMTGWRLGYGVMPRDLARAISQLLGNSMSCTCTFTQIAGVAALQGSQRSVRDMVEKFRVRRDLIVDGLNSVPGIRCHRPSGAFYAFPNIRDTGMTSGELVNLLLEKAGVAVLSGTTFGALGEGYIRLSYANSQENIKKAVERIGDALAGIR